MATHSDWFVAPDVEPGDGSRDAPFHDPWLAIRAASPGDVIHVAAGTYFGRLDRSSWSIDCPTLTIRGGYSRDFSARAPWRTPSVLAAFPEYEGRREDSLLRGTDDHSGLLLDGLCFDPSGSNSYGSGPAEGLVFGRGSGPIVWFNSDDVTITNCLFLNGAAGGVDLGGDGSRFENNLVVNIVGPSMLNLRSVSRGDKRPIIVTGNTFCFAHDAGGSPLGAGADRGIGVRTARTAVIRGNVFVSCGNAAITYFYDPERLSIERNLFYLTPRDVVNGRQATFVDITERNFDELADVGLKSMSGNVIQDPGLSGLEPAWLDAYSRHLLARYATPPWDTVNALRATAGLPVLGPADFEGASDKGQLAPRLVPRDALALRFGAERGFHAIDLPTEFSGTPVSEPPAPRAVDWNSVSSPVPALANERVGLRAGIGSEQNSTMLPDAGPATHRGVRLYVPGSNDESMFVLVRRHTLASRQFDDAVKYTNGRDVEHAYLVRGVYRTDVEPRSRQKVTLVVDSIVPAPMVAKPSTRPPGRDWFVKAGASGGDGTRDTPFRDPFQALDKAEGGDTIHVAGGVYFGKLRSGQWRIGIRNLALLGGYDATFASRDPWRNPTRFALDEAEKQKNGVPSGPILGSEDNSDGLILDGFVFDGATYNTYGPDGSLDLRQSLMDQLVDVGGRRSMSVRNCLFLNGAAGAVSLACAAGAFENNVVLNTNGRPVSIRGDGSGPWVVRNNTVLFGADARGRAGEGTAEGTLLYLSGRAVTVVESNIFAFADTCGVRTTNARQHVTLENNVFAANLHHHVTDGQYLWADAARFERRVVADAGFAAVRGNRFDLPELPLDAAFADVALSRLFTLPSRVSTEQWTTIASLVGSSARPATALAERQVEAPAPMATAAPSLTDLLADLGRIKAAETEEAEAAGRSAAAAAPAYCPVYDWTKAPALARETPIAEPGAHRLALPVSFAAIQAKSTVQYLRVTPEQVEGDRSVLANRAIEIDVKEASLASSHVDLFPEGTSRDDYDAFFAVAAGGSTRSRVAMVVRLDTNARKLVGRSAATDTLRIRGTTHVLGRTLSILVDSVEIVEP